MAKSNFAPFALLGLGGLGLYLWKRRPAPDPVPGCPEGYEPMLNQDGNVVLDDGEPICEEVITEIPECGEGYVYDALQGVCVPSSVDVPPPPTGVLKQGSSGPKVVALQRKICAFWRTIGPVNPAQFGSTSWGDFDDGKFGPGTKKAVKEAQAYMGIASDGQAGPVTQSALNQQLASVGISPTEAENTSCQQSFDT